MIRPDIHTSEGWAIIDRRERPWGGSLFATREAAEETARRCGMDAPRIAWAKRVEWYGVKPGNTQETLHDRWVIEETNR